MRAPFSMLLFREKRNRLHFCSNLLRLLKNQHFCIPLRYNVRRKVVLYTLVYFTGDIHGVPKKIVRFCKHMNPTKDDVIVILGDVGANYTGDQRDDDMKKLLSSVTPTILCIHGNHEMRPWHVEGYELKTWSGGQVYVQSEYPNLLFAKDGEIFEINGLRYIVIGGAYSVDKYFRLRIGRGWWEDEQPSDEIKEYVEKQLADNKIDVVLSHTCPLKYEPTEMFLPMIDQSSVDQSTEIWLDKIEESIEYKAWFCGHWHTDKRVDKVHFLFNGFESEEWLHDENNSR